MARQHRGVDVVIARRERRRHRRGECQAPMCFARNVHQVCDGVVRRWGRYRDTVRSETMNPSFSNLPWIRGAPQRQFSVAMRPMRLRSCESMRGRSGRRRERWLQHPRNPSRCQRATVGGGLYAWTGGPSTVTARNAARIAHRMASKRANINDTFASFLPRTRYWRRAGPFPRTGTTPSRFRVRVQGDPDDAAFRSTSPMSKARGRLVSQKYGVRVSGQAAAARSPCDSSGPVLMKPLQKFT